jgi:hypothetical protein
MTYRRTDEHGEIPNAVTDLGLAHGQEITLTFTLAYPGSGTSDLTVPNLPGVVLQIPNRMLARAMIAGDRKLADARHEGFLDGLDDVDDRAADKNTLG